MVRHFYHTGKGSKSSLSLAAMVGSETVCSSQQGGNTILQGYSHLKGKGILTVLYASVGFSGGSKGKESACNVGERAGFDPWVQKVPWRRAWHPTPLFLPEESP